MADHMGVDGYARAGQDDRSGSQPGLHRAGVAGHEAVFAQPGKPILPVSQFVSRRIPALSSRRSDTEAMGGIPGHPPRFLRGAKCSAPAATHTAQIF